jgi:hypothetical protein
VPTVQSESKPRRTGCTGGIDAGAVAGVAGDVEDLLPRLSVRVDPPLTICTRWSGAPGALTVPGSRKASTPKRGLRSPRTGPISLPIGTPPR